MGVFCGDEVVVGLKTALAEFVDDVRLPIEKKNDFIFEIVNYFRYWLKLMVARCLYDDFESMYSMKDHLMV